MRSRGAMCLLIIISLLAAGTAVATTIGGGAGVKPTIVLDPDHGYANAVHDGVTYNSFPFNLAIAQAVQAQLPSVCDSTVVLTQTTDSLTNAQRAAQMTNADVSVTLSLDSLFGVDWGTQAEGGAKAFATPKADNLAFGNELASDMGAATGRPFDLVNQGPIKQGLTLPYPEFKALPGTYAHFFMLYLDESYDWEVIKSARDLMVNAVVTALAHTLQAQGFQCLGTFPSLPSAARLQQLRNLGYQRFLRYAAEPVSMSTGNFSTAERIFSLPGVGNQEIDLTLDYNAQSAQDSPIGFGWQFVYGSFMQQYNDGSVAVFLPDGHALLYVPDGSSGFTGPPGAFASLAQLTNTTFKWTTATGSSMTFTQDSSGRGRLTATSDRQGNTETQTYNGDGAHFPNLSAITDQAGQTVQVGTDTDGRITSFTRPDGATWRLGYSTAGDLTSLTSPRGTVRHFNYDSLHRMTSEVGQDGVTFLTNTYDNQSRVVGQTNAFGDPRSLSYDDANRKTTYTDATGASSIYSWNALGQITAIQDALGGITTTDYNAEFLPSNQTDPLSHTTSTAYDASGQPSSVTDPLGNAVTSTYNAAGDLTSHTDQGGTGGEPRTFASTVNSAGLPTVVTNPDATTQGRTYDNFGDLTSSTDETGAIAAYGYDARGNVTTVTDPLGRVTTMTHDAANRQTSVTDPLGHTTLFGYDANDNVTQITYPNGSTETRSYDVNDLLSSSTDRRGATTTYAHDAELNAVSLTLPNGGVVHNTFDKEDRLTSTTDPLGNKTSYTLDALGRPVATTDARGNTTKTTYDAAGQLVSQTDASGATTSLARDAKGQILSTTDALGGVATNTWDKVGRRTSVTDPLGHTTTYAYNFRDQVISVNDPAGGVTTNTYDVAGRLVKTTDAAGASTTNTLDAAGQVIKTTDALGGVTRFGYDAAGNRTSVTDANVHTATTTYDVMNEPIARADGNGKTWTTQRDPGGLVLHEADPLGHQTAYSHDAIGNLTSKIDPLGRTTTLAYDLDQRQTTEAAPDGIATAFQYDPLGNLTAVTQNARTGVTPGPSVNVKTTHGYDARNLLTTTTDPNGGMTTYGYDVRGLRTSETNPLGKVTAFTYDAAGNKATRTDANGVTTMYDYDTRNLLTKQSYPGGKTETFAYDAVGRQVTATNANGAVATTYDSLGRKTSVTDAAGKTLQYSYDPASNRTRLRLPDGRVLAYGYDAADELTQLNSPLGGLTMSYDTAGRLVGVARPNTAKTTLTYDNANELTSMETKPGLAALASFAYSYDAVGNVGRRVQNVGGPTTTTDYVYDPLRRLTASVGGPLPSTYRYDAAGNRLAWSAPDDPYTPKPSDPFTQTNSFDASGQLTKSVTARHNGGASFTSTTTNVYDGDGNRLQATTIAQAPGQSTGTKYTYDFENRLLTSVPSDPLPNRGDGNDQRKYARTYDALGRLVTETRGTTKTTWTEDGLDPIMASDVADTLYLRDLQGGLQGELTGSIPAWYITDALGSILGSTNNNAKLANTTAYSDYGVKLSIGAFRMGFSGELTDPNYPGNGIGNDTPVLTHYFARTYDPGHGTWMQPDPIRPAIRQPTTLARYQYARNNPTTNRDLLGYLSVGVDTTSYNITVGVSNGSWNGGSLQGGATAQYLQPTVSAQYLQPTISAQQLQPTTNPFIRTCRSPAAYGQAGAVGYCAPLGGWALQGTNTSPQASSGFAQPLNGSPPYSGLTVVAGIAGFASDFIQGYSDIALIEVSSYLRGSVSVSNYARYAPGIPNDYRVLPAGELSTVQEWVGNGAFVLSVGVGAFDTYQTYRQTRDRRQAEATALAGSAGIFVGSLGATVGEGAAIGLVCGPGAPLCSGVGAATGGLIATGIYAWQVRDRLRNWVRRW
jgi:RHS repeat-associated protein